MSITIVTQPYNTAGKGRGGASGPATIVKVGLTEKLAAQGHQVAGVHEVTLSAEEDARYGGWNRVALAGSRLSDLVASARRDDSFVLGLLADCNGVLGMLGGLQRPASNEWPSLPRRVGLVYIDAHGDYNTPETSPSGMLGGMPVAVAAGKALHRFRKENGLALPLQSPDIVMAGLRDLDGLEREMVLEDGLITLTEQDLIERSERMHAALRALCAREELVYVHVDLDILDPSCAPAAGLPSPGGLTGEQLGAALVEMTAYPQVKALVFVSYRADDDRDGGTLREVERAILGATVGIA